MYTQALFELLVLTLWVSNSFYKTDARTIHLPEQNITAAISEWTGMGDSYASGIGSGTMIQSYDGTCYRQNEAYPFLLEGNLQPRRPRFNFVACSGDTFEKIRRYQFRDQPSSYKRPYWGERPRFATLSMGGNDIDFFNLVLLCIYSINLGSYKNCDEVIAYSQGRVKSKDFIDDAKDVITAALENGERRGVPDFKVYVTGYAQFFNESSPQCSGISFSPKWVPRRLKAWLTIDLRRELNAIARGLNAALASAVASANVKRPNRVFFVDYDQQFEGHRFCDRIEPNLTDPDTWFFTYGSKEAAVGQLFHSIPQIRQLLSGQSNATMTYDDFFRIVSQAAGNNREKMEVNSWAFRVFHPKPLGHMAIERILRHVVTSTTGNPVLDLAMVDPIEVS